MEINKHLLNSLLLATNKNVNIRNKISDLMISNKTKREPLGISTDITEVLKEILKSSGLNVTSENVKMLKYIVDNNIPLDSETLNKLNKGLKLFNLMETTTLTNTVNLHGSEQNLDSNEYYKAPRPNVIPNKDSIDKAIFMLKNDIPISNSNAYILNRIVDGDGNFVSILKDVVENIYTITDPVLKTQAINTLINDNLNDSKTIVIHTKTNNDTELVDIKNQTSDFKLSKNSDRINLDNLNLNEKIIVDLNKNKANIEEKVNDKTFTTNDLNNILQLTTPLTKEDMLDIATILFKDKPKVYKDFIKILNINISQNNIKKNSLISLLTNKLTLDYNSNNLKHIDNQLSNLNKNLTSIENLLLNTPFTNTLESVSYARDTIEFLNLINESTYIPLPINLGEITVQSELFIFKDGKLNRSNKKAVSALVALNTLNLGRVETYIQKNDNFLNLQFRLENIENQLLLKSNIETLHTLLQDYNYTIQSYTVIPIDKPFNILFKEPLKEVKPNFNINTTIDTRA